MSKHILEYHLDTLESTNSFVFQIVEQSDRLTNYVKARGTFAASNSWRVMIDEEPEIDLENKIIYLQGRNASLDHKVERYWDLNGKELKNAIKGIRKTLEEVCSAAKGWTSKHSLNVIDVIVIEPRCLNLFDLVRNNPLRITYSR